MGEHYACSQQSRTKRNTGINGARPNPTASRSHHRNGALTANMWSNPAANQPAEETSPFRKRCQQRARLQTKATLDSVEHRLCGLDLVISARRRSFNVDNDCACGQDWARSQLVLSFEGREIFPDCARLTFGLSPDDLFGCLAMVATSVGLHDAGVDGEPFALDQTS
jgi:hypothetical protein